MKMYIHHPASVLFCALLTISACTYLLEFSICVRKEQCNNNYLTASAISSAAMAAPMPPLIPPATHPMIAPIAAPGTAPTPPKRAPIAPPNESQHTPVF